MALHGVALALSFARVTRVVLARYTSSSREPVLFSADLTSVCTLSGDTAVVNPEPSLSYLNVRRIQLGNGLLQRFSLERRARSADHSCCGQRDARFSLASRFRDTIFNSIQILTASDAESRRRESRSRACCNIRFCSVPLIGRVLEPRYGESRENLSIDSGPNYAVP